MVIQDSRLHRTALTCRFAIDAHGQNPDLPLLATNEPMWPVHAMTMSLSTVKFPFDTTAVRDKRTKQPRPAIHAQPWQTHPYLSRVKSAQQVVDVAGNVKPS